MEVCASCLQLTATKITPCCRSPICSPCLQDLTINTCPECWTKSSDQPMLDADYQVVVMTGWCTQLQEQLIARLSILNQRFTRHHQITTFLQQWYREYFSPDIQTLAPALKTWVLAKDQDMVQYNRLARFNLPMVPQLGWLLTFNNQLVAALTTPLVPLPLPELYRGGINCLDIQCRSLAKHSVLISKEEAFSTILYDDSFSNISVILPDETVEIFDTTPVEQLYKSTMCFLRVRVRLIDNQVRFYVPIRYEAIDTQPKHVMIHMFMSTECHNGIKQLQLIKKYYVPFDGGLAFMFVLPTGFMLMYTDHVEMFDLEGVTMWRLALPSQIKTFYYEPIISSAILGLKEGQTYVVQVETGHVMIQATVLPQKGKLIQQRLGLSYYGESNPSHYLVIYTWDGLELSRIPCPASESYNITGTTLIYGDTL